MKRVLSVASEAVPLVKTGGLADVVGALPAALAEHGWEMRVIIPAYPGVLDKIGRGDQIWADPNLFGGLGRVYLGKVGAMEVMALDAPHLYDRSGGPYSDYHGDYPDNAERFAALCRCAVSIAMDGAGGWKPDVLHAHDWQAALAPAFLRWWGASTPSVLTVHNIAFQGQFGADKIGALHMALHDFHPGGYEYWGGVSTLKAGLNLASAITTVSPHYAEELMRPEFGLGLEGVIENRAAVVQGILNGIDHDVWNPETDPEIIPFSATKPAGKAKNRAALQAEFGLVEEVNGPLVVMVSRLTPQKGIDLLPAAVEELVAHGGALCLLGSGDAANEDSVRALAARYPGRVGLRIGYDEGMSHRMFAGGDAVLVPSRFEPCGLTQLYGLRYGCLPIVSAVGGLSDTVIGATPATAAVANGVIFNPVDDLALRQGVRRLCGLYADRKIWTTMVKRAMKADWGWGASAARYAALYDSLVHK